MDLNDSCLLKIMNFGLDLRPIDLRNIVQVENRKLNDLN